MKKQCTYTAIILAAMTLTGCGETNTIFQMNADTAVVGEKEKAVSPEPAEEFAGEEAKIAEEAADDGAPTEEAGVEKAAGDAEVKDAAAADAALKTMDMELAPEKPADEPAEEPSDEPIKGAVVDTSKAFVLTAGEWNDNENWGFFANLVHNDTISFPSYGLDPVNRVAVTVTNGGAPVRNQTVQLKAKDILWTAKTDNNGMAYLFYDSAFAGSELTIETDDADAVSFTAPSDASGQGGRSVPVLEYTLETSAEAQSYSDTEVCFMLDTTGSMGDEITYLQMDFAAIAEEVARDGMTFSVNFYRDEGDAYVTRCNPFTDDVKSVQQALNQEYADGGGDTPEAVAEILDEVMTKGDWHENTNKIAFLIFDAPPHSGSEQENMILNAVKAAAEQGIHVVPVVASNADRETELFGRALSIMTDANYVFLTDDSGVGESHLEPIIGDYDVELLHDIIVRNINEIAG